MKVKDLAKNAILIAVYILAVNINPIGFMAIQFRVAEALSVIPFFNRKFVPALIIGGALFTTRISRYGCGGSMCHYNLYF